MNLSIIFILLVFFVVILPFNDARICKNFSKINVKYIFLYSSWEQQAWAVPGTIFKI